MLWFLKLKKQHNYLPEVVITQDICNKFIEIKFMDVWFGRDALCYIPNKFPLKISEIEIQGLPALPKFSYTLTLSQSEGADYAHRPPIWLCLT